MVEDDDIPLYQYSPQPSSSSREEKGLWGAFISWAIAKFTQGERFLEARVRNEEAKAAKTEAEARAIAEEADRRSQEFEIAKIDDKNKKIKELSQELQEKIDELQIINGGKFEIGLNLEDNPAKKEVVYTNKEKGFGFVAPQASEGTDQKSNIKKVSPKEEGGEKFG